MQNIRTEYPPAVSLLRANDCAGRKNAHEENSLHFSEVREINFDVLYLVCTRKRAIVIIILISIYRYAVPGFVYEFHFHFSLSRNRRLTIL